MTYYIFLKSLRSLEEFRKNPHIKIPPKSPCINFQSLDIFKNLIFYLEKIFPSNFGPVTRRPVRAFDPHGPPDLSSSLTAPAERRLLLSRRHALDAAPSFSRTMEPPTPPLITPPLQLVVVTTSFPPGNDSHEGTNYRRHPPFPATPASSRPNKRAPTLRWSTSPLHLASSPPHSCTHRSRLEPKPRRRSATSSPLSELR
jgi:hypothetical protein